MTRRVGFSSGHRYWIKSLDEVENRLVFGRWASPYNHGHNYVLDVTVQGEPDRINGMIVNIKKIDEILRKEVVDEFDQRSLNDEVPAFHERVPSIENLLQEVWRRMERSLPPEAELVSLRLEESPLLWGELEYTTMTLTRVYEFAASHRLHAPDLTQEENIALYGKCNNEAGHGHNYVLEVTVEGEPDPRTGFICNLSDLDKAVHEKVVDRYDHRNLNSDLPEFKGRPTTSEVVTQEIYNRLKDAFPAKLKRVRLWETARNAFEVNA